MTGGQDDGPLRPGGQPGPDQPPDCESLDLTVALSSLEPAVVDDASVGDPVAVCLESDGAGGTLVVVRDSSGRQLGTIAEQLPSLLPCLQRGHVYVGDIVRIDGGNVRVHLTARSPYGEDVTVSLTAPIAAREWCPLELRDGPGDTVIVVVVTNGIDTATVTSHSAALIAALNRNHTFGFTAETDMGVGDHEVHVRPRR